VGNLSESHASSDRNGIGKDVVMKEMLSIIRILRIGFLSSGETAKNPVSIWKDPGKVPKDPRPRLKSPALMLRLYSPDLL